MDTCSRKQLVLLVITCALGVFSGCEKGCEQTKPQQASVLQPAQTESAEKGVRADIPTGIESPAVKSETPGDLTRRASATAAHGSDKAVVHKTKPPEASSPNVVKKTVTKEPKRADTTHAAQANVSAPAIATPVAPPAEKAEAKAPTKVVVPQTAYVRAEVPAGLQRLLDDDPRMQPWVNKVMEVAEQCHAKERGYNPLAKGAIAVNITMHQNERPDASLGSLPPGLSGIIACATGKLTGSRMPFFTGDEGAKYTVRIHFTR
jgi:hypothetical protein